MRTAMARREGAEFAAVDTTINAEPRGVIQITMASEERHGVSEVVSAILMSSGEVAYGTRPERTVGSPQIRAEIS